MKVANKISIGALIVIAVCIMTMPAKAADFDVKSYLANVHIRIGAAYKLEETAIWFKGERMNKATTARLGAWYRFNNMFAKGDSLDFGVDHHSQYFERARKEYSKTELFIDYTFSLGGLL